MGSCQTTRGADVNAQDDQRDSALPLAGASGFTEIAHATLAAGADLQSLNRHGGTALIPRWGGADGPGPIPAGP